MSPALLLSLVLEPGRLLACPVAGVLVTGSGAAGWLPTALVGIVLAALLWRLGAVLARLDARVARLEDAAHRLARAVPRPGTETEAPVPRGGDLARALGLLEDLRDVQRRLDDRLAALAERATAPPAVVALQAPASSLAGPAGLVEHALNRLLALGYEQIEIVTPRDAVDPDGAILVEARRGGAIYKGEVRLSGGVVADVDLRPSHALFP